jgi:hypothetical protein
VACNPLYISSRFDKPYLFAEMLKRDDIDLDVGSGTDGKTYIFNMLQFCPEDTVAYIFYSSKNPRVIENITKKIEPFRNNSKQKSTMLNILNKTFPNVPEYDSESGSIKVPRKLFPAIAEEHFEYDSNNRTMNSFDDVMRNLDVDVNYTNKKGIGALDCARTSEFYSIAEMIENKAKMNKRQNNGGFWAKIWGRD